MGTTASIKISSQLVEDARSEGAIMNRSIAGQVEHWATLGRRMENAFGFGMDRVRAALQGKFDPGNLSEQERRYYYDLLDNDLGSPSDAEIRTMAAIGRQQGAAGYDDAGQLVTVGADGKTTAVPE
jgi:hypothetical protein